MKKILISLLMLTGTCFAQFFSTTPLNDLGQGLYLNQFEGGLYENGTNSVPSDHDAAGIAVAATVTPINGKYVLMSLGMSNAANEFGYFLNIKLKNNPALNASLKVVNGANPVEGPCQFQVAFGDPFYLCGGSNGHVNAYDYERDHYLTPAGMTEDQVEIIWYKFAIPFSAQLPDPPTLPAANANAYVYETVMGGTLRAMKQRYPNLKMVFFSSRIYGGYCGPTCKSREPYAFEYGFSTKWLLETHINQADRGAGCDSYAGCLSYSDSPWAAWGPYIWADGQNPRSDGLKWCAGTVTPGPPCNGEQDFAADLLHPNTTGQKKVSDMLWTFFSTSPYTMGWFLHP